MAYAKTRIDAGKDKDGKLRVFEVGQEVTGLSDDELKQLQDAGSLQDHAPREGEPGYQAAPDSDVVQQQKEREQALRDAANSGVTGPSSTQDPTTAAREREARERQQRGGSTATSDATRRELTSQSSGADASGAPNAGTQTTTGNAGNTETTTRRGR